MAVLSHDDPLPADTEERVGEFTELVATAIGNVEARSQLAARAPVQAANEQPPRVVRDLHHGVRARLSTPRSRSSSRPDETTCHRR